MVPGVLGVFKTPEGRKLLRYSMASAVAVATSFTCIILFNGVIGWSAWVSATLATAIATIPSYELNRKWAWGKTGQGHLWKEVVPFWVLAFIGWGFSTICVKVAEDYAKHHHFTHLARTSIVAIVYLGAFGVLWIGKFIFFNKVLFAHHPQDLPPALDGRTGLPS